MGSRPRRGVPGKQTAEGMEAPDHGISVDSSANARGRLTALGYQLIETHARLLEALDDIRDGADPPRDLATHCLTFCAAVTEHHTDEDDTVFPALAARHPELREVLEGLEHDHQIMAGMLRRVSDLAGRIDTDGALAELDGLAALLESHFAWEERRLVDALNVLPPGEI
jgi:hemerythrin-like domain-containing protein